jgi:hypothetical protein
MKPITAIAYHASKKAHINLRVALFCISTLFSFSGPVLVQLISVDVDNLKTARQTAIQGLVVEKEVVIVGVICHIGKQVSSMLQSSFKGGFHQQCITSDKLESCLYH